MEEEIMDNITREEVIEAMVLFPLEPMRHKLIVSVNTKEEEGIHLGEEGFDETQYVIAVGSTVDEKIKPGCKVLLDLDKMSVRGQDENGNPTLAIQIKPVKVNGRIYALINDSAVDAVDNR